MNWSIIMEMIVSLAVLIFIGLLILGWYEEHRDNDVIKIPPRPDRIVNNWKYSGLPPR